MAVNDDEALCGDIECPSTFISGGILMSDDKNRYHGDYSSYDDNQQNLPDNIPGQGPREHYDYRHDHYEPQDPKSSWRDKLGKAANFASKAGEKFARKSQESYQEWQQRKAEQEARAKEQQRLAASQQRQAFEQQRRHDIELALSRNISTGGAGVPYMVMDVVFAFAETGGERGEATRPGDAFEECKDKLWQQCLYLGGDAILFSRFGWDRDEAMFTSGGAVAYNAAVNAMSALVRTPAPRLNTTKTQKVIRVWGHGTVVKLLPQNSPAEPDDYARLSIDNLDLSPME